MTKMILLGFPDYAAPAQRLASAFGTAYAEVGVHRFPDGESLVRLPAGLPERVIFCRSLDRPNDKLFELLLSARTARELGARRIILVAPYLCYMRQDVANHPGEAVSQRIVGGLLAELFDDVITVDPHLHRIDSLHQAIPLDNAIALTAAEEIAAFLQDKFDRALLLGPDSESEQWVAGIAQRTGFDYAVAEKQRYGDRQVAIALPDIDYTSRAVVIVDDMASTGRTIAQAARLLQTAAAPEIYAVVTHPLFCSDAQQQIIAAGVRSIWSTDSIDHATSVVHLDALIADALRSLF